MEEQLGKAVDELLQSLRKVLASMREASAELSRGNQVAPELNSSIRKAAAELQEVCSEVESLAAKYERDIGKGRGEAKQV